MNRCFLLALALATALPLLAQRRPVLEQIDLPHSYYFREMYLPQLTSGPSGVAWSPDSKSVIYSMAGSLWRQEIDSESAQQLTAGPGYDYQPDWSPDGRWVVFARYFADTIELHLLEVATGRSYQLTAGGAVGVNVEPRWSPDGTRIAFVSTAYHKRFHIFLARVKEGVLQSVQRLTGESESALPRYYYSKYDTEISPAWSRDGEELVFVSNRGHIYGTGGFWRMKAEPGAEAREFYYEETAWKAHPEFAPDGKRLVYSSYLGRQWNQLWLMPAEGGHPLQLTYGEYDNTAPRWSPDGKHIAFISNRSSNTEMWLLDPPGGAQRQLLAKQRKYLRPMAHLLVRVLDAAGKPTAARVSVTGADGLAYAPDDAWVHADDGYDRSQRRFEAHYFHSPGQARVTAPAGRVTVEVMKGFSNRFERRELDLLPDQQLALTVRLKPLKLPGPAGWRWVSGDLHVHMNYGGTYRNTPKNMVAQAEAEDVNVVENLIVNKEQRVPDIAYAGMGLDAASVNGRLLVHDQEFHTSYWGHLGLLDLQHLILPDYAGYPGTAAASLYPSNALVADLAHEQHALVGYVHPFDDPPNVEGGVNGAAGSAAAPLTDELPVDVALGKVDYIEVVGFSEHRTTADVWYRLLNLGFRLPTGAGTDAMANYASLRGPVGMNRVFLPASPATLKLDEGFYPMLKRGATFATNGPLVWFRLGEKMPGSDLKLAAGKHEVKFSAWLRSIVPVDHLEMVCNGKVARTLELKGERDSGDFSGTLPISRSGWCLLRAWSEKAEHPVLDIYPYATTSPVYVTVEGAPVAPAEDAAYFVKWIDRVREAVEKHTGWNTEAERAAVLRSLAEARAVYEGKGKR